MSGGTAVPLTPTKWGELCIPEHPNRCVHPEVPTGTRSQPLCPPPPPIACAALCHADLIHEMEHFRKLASVPFMRQFHKIVPYVHAFRFPWALLINALMLTYYHDVCTACGAVGRVRGPGEGFA